MPPSTYLGLFQIIFSQKYATHRSSIREVYMIPILVWWSCLSYTDLIFVWYNVPYYNDCDIWNGWCSGFLVWVRYGTLHTVWNPFVSQSCLYIESKRWFCVKAYLRIALGAESSRFPNEYILAICGINCEILDLILWLGQQVLFD